MQPLGFLFCWALLWSSLVAAQFSPTLWTSFVPLAVRSPYFSAWMNTTDNPAGRAPNNWPGFWTNQILGWAGHVRVDGVTWKWQGAAGGAGPLNNSVLTNIQITPTRTIFNITAGSVDVSVTYFSPIEPSDPVKQSMAFSYITLIAQSNDGQPHAVQVYADISGEWLSNDLKAVMNWNSQTTDTIMYHETFLQTPLMFTEDGQIIKDSKVYHAMLLRPDMTWAEEAHVDARFAFGRDGKLGNSALQGPKGIGDNFPIFAISVDMGTIDDTTSKPVTWGLGMLREKPIAYTAPGGIQQQRAGYWTSKYSVAADAVTDFLQDYDNALERALKFENDLLQGAAAVSAQYADLISLTARQAMAGTELTIGQNSDGSYNFSDVKMFMKDVGPSGRVNPVELMYATFPFFLSVNASYAGWLLDPVLEFASSASWNFVYAPRDIGLNYPNATGNANSHHQGVEQSGNMLIMTLAHARTSGDGSYISKYYPLLKTWADYLVNNTSPIPNDQVTADVGARANSTNLAIKGIIAINAMAEISTAAHNPTDAEHYASVAKAYANTWQSLAVQSNHIVSNFGDQSSSWALPYNLYAHKFLGMNLIDSKIFDQETAFLGSTITANSLGLPINSDANADGNTAWTMFTAATTTDGTVRDAMIGQLWGYASRNVSRTIFPSEFQLNGLGSAKGTNNPASPGVGGIFAPLGLSLKNVSITVPQSAASTVPKKKSNVGPIVGGVVGGIGGFLLLLGLGIFFWRRYRQQEDPNGGEKGILGFGGAASTTTPIPYNYARENLPPIETTPFVMPGAADASTPQVDVYSGSISSAKAREAALAAAQVRGHHPQPSSSFTATTDPASSREPPSAPASSSAGRSGGGSVTSPLSPSEVQGLRAEVENLRRVMQAFQPDTFHGDRLEPPPEYHEEPRP